MWTDTQFLMVLIPEANIVKSELTLCTTVSGGWMEFSSLVCPQ